MLINVALGALFALSLLTRLRPSIRMILAAALCYRLMPASYGEFLAGAMVIIAGLLAKASIYGPPVEGAPGTSRIDRVSKTSVGRSGEPR